MKSHPDQALIEQCVLVAASCASTNLRRANRAATQFYARVMEPSGLEPTQFTLLTACAVAGPAPLTALAEALVMDRTTLTRNLRLLVKQGLVKVVEGNDRRVHIVELSREGRTVLAKALPLWQKAQDQMIAGLGQERLNSLLQDLSAVVELTQAA